MNRLSGKLDAMLQQAQRQTEIEIRLVAELLDVSRIEMQKFEVHLRPCNLSAIVQQVVANQQVSSTRTITLTLPTQPVVPVMADPDRIEQALTNYLTNACKYSPSNQTIQVQMTVTGNMARVSVCDQGPGLTVEQQEHVWDRFYPIQSLHPWRRSGPGVVYCAHHYRSASGAGGRREHSRSGSGVLVYAAACRRARRELIEPLEIC
jgi:signal transduction histidine kinase